MENTKNIREILKHKILVLDGAMGSLIQTYKLQEEDYRGERFKDYHMLVKGNNDLLSITRPDIIKEIHGMYLEAGSDIIETNTFNSTRISQADYNMEEYVWEINYASAKLAREIADEYTQKTPHKPRFVCGTLGPMNKALTLSPDVNNPGFRAVTFDEVKTSYIEATDALIDGGADIIMIETIFDTLNAKAAIMAIEEVYEKKGVNLPVMISGTITDASGRTLSGQTLEAFLTSVSHLDLLSIGLNCSLGAKELEPYVIELSNKAPFYISTHPNAGLPNQFGEYDQSPAQMAGLMSKWLDQGKVNIIGGCCGTTPSHIKALAEIADKYNIHKRNKRDNITRLSGLEPLKITPEINFVNIGERCNVAGSKMFLRLIKEKKYEEAVNVARHQVENGAQIIDVNMDDAMLDAKDEMVKFLNMLVSDPDVSRVPVMVDSSKFEVIEAGLKCLQGKSVVNSISLKEGEEQFLKHARIVKKYGAAVVVMAFDEKGQADSFERRKEICTRAYNLLVDKVGFPPEDIIFDPNVLAIATGIEEHNNYGIDFINSAKWIKANLPHAHISGGISNLSFSFRGNNVVREAIHSVFLYHAIQAGLDMGIVNPAMLQIYDDIPKELLEYTEDVVLNRRPDATERLVDYAEKIKDQNNNETVTKVAAWREGTLEERLSYCLVKGIGDFLPIDINEALEKYDTALEIIEKPLMAGMNVVGELFGAGKMFLPQVVKTARIMKAAVAILLPYIEAEKKEGKSSAGKILMATVKGDVHDIGKNIVGVILGCNNYEVIDLGVMVPTEKILETALKENVDIIGLSGLITPSLEEMANVAAEMEKRGIKLPLMIGGATTSKIHTAVKIDTQYSGTVVYVKDASQSAQVTSNLMSAIKKDAYHTEMKEEYKKMRDNYTAKATRKMYSLEEATKKKFKIDFKQEDIATPTFLGTKTIEDISIDVIRKYIDWSFLFKAWRLPGKYKGIQLFATEKEKDAWLETFTEGIDRDKAREVASLYHDANLMLDKWIADKSLRCKAVLGFFEAKSDENDILFYREDKEPFRFPFLRQQVENKTGAYTSLCDFIAPSTSDLSDYIGAFAVTAGLGLPEISKAYENANDDYSSILAQTLADRLAEAAAEWMHEEIRKKYWGFNPDENLSLSDMFRINYRGIRPAIGYPSMPNQADNFLLEKLIPLNDAEISLTENGAMYPNASVSCLVFAHPQSEYLAIGLIGTDQMDDYSKRLGISREALAKWLPDQI